jgi:hypothetical protein
MLNRWNFSRENGDDRTILRLCGCLYGIRSGWRIGRRKLDMWMVSGGAPGKNFTDLSVSYGIPVKGSSRE